MNIVAKHITKNIIAKPFRSIILFVCIAVCSFVALLSVDMTGSIELMVKAMGAQIVGNSDIIFDDAVGFTEELPLSYETNQLLVYSREDGVIKSIDGIYNYFRKESFSVNYVDYEKAYEMSLLPKKLMLDGDEAAISKRLSERNGWKTGDTISLVDDMGNEHKYKIVCELPENGLANGTFSLFVSEEGYRTLTSNVRARHGYIDVINDKESKQVLEEIKTKYYNITGSLIMDSEENKEMIKSLSLMMALIFMVCLLLVVFVAISLSSRIVCERMSVVGTFRSLGLSSGFTTKLLLLETAGYGLIGAIIGSLFYGLVRKSIFSSIFSVSVSGVTIQMDYGHLNPVMLVLVLVLAMLIMCACPLKEIVKTSKMAIRDIIFDNKDTAYKYNKKTLVFGIAVAVVAGVTFMFKNHVMAQFVCFPSILIATAMLFPWLLKALAGLLSKCFERMNKPIAKLAANEVRFRKSTIGSSVLCVTISMLAIVIFIFVSTTSSIYDLDTYNCDVVATINYREKPEQFAYVDDISGVTDTEFIYKSYEKIKFDNESKDINIFGLNEGGYKYLSGIKDCPAHLEKNEFVMDKSLAKKLGLKVSDTVEVVFGEDDFMPITKSLTLVGYINSYDYDSTSNSVVIAKDLFIDIYHDYPGLLLVQGKDEKIIADTLRKYSFNALESVETLQEIKAYWVNKGKGMKTILLAIIILGVSLSMIGMISNQLIGFEGRKRECAVLASVAMSRGCISKMLMLENIFATAISLIAAFPLALFSFIPFRRILEDLSGAFKVIYDVPAYVIFLIILLLVFGLVVLFPIKELKKMNIASRLKYE